MRAYMNIIYKLLVNILLCICILLSYATAVCVCVLVSACVFVCVLRIWLCTKIYIGMHGN